MRTSFVSGQHHGIVQFTDSRSRLRPNRPGWEAPLLADGRCCCFSSPTTTGGRACGNGSDPVLDTDWIGGRVSLASSFDSAGPPRPLLTHLVGCSSQYRSSPIVLAGGTTFNASKWATMPSSAASSLLLRLSLCSPPRKGSIVATDPFRDTAVAVGCCANWIGPGI